MFNNIGKKIKVVASVFCWIGIIASVVFGIILIDEGDEVAGAVTLVAGALSSWIGSFALYGFGQLVENSDIQTRIMQQEQKERELRKSEPNPSAIYRPSFASTSVNNSTSKLQENRLLQKDEWKCSCGRINKSYTWTCACGKSRSEMH